MVDEENRCEHAGCLCVVSDESDYCSDHCENAESQDMTEIACDCGHPGCVA